MARSVKVVATPVPQTKHEMALMVSRIGVINGSLERVEAQRDQRIAAVYQMATEKSGPLLKERSELVEAVAAYCEAHRDELTDKGKTKTVKLPSGELRWRFTPPKVTLKGVPKVLAYLKSNALTQFVRTKEEVNKEAMLAEPAKALAIPGVNISRTEEFIIQPNKGGEIVGKTTKVS